MLKTLGPDDYKQAMDLKMNNYIPVDLKGNLE
jgi:hypothetical protein